ncbi:kinesin-like protein KIN-UB [Salvia hispanica]|uniref:kinesin-like protein KIN-UB n=1 Tax=Salvia hispanica TaxID=49212 RepID=UPI002009CAC9|nr:kinesin-like protein KIN-UB [Salvia hispanica]
MAAARANRNGANLRTSASFKSKLPPSNVRRSGVAVDSVSGRVRVAVRLRPQNTEELVADADFADCVDLQPELKRLKLRKNNWDSDTYEFDEVLTEFASQKRVYEVVAKPVVESVLEGYNGTVMAYGQTGTGKTYTVGRLGDEDTSARGIMVRAMEDILANISPETDSISVSFLQLYMESIQDLLNPANDNISIVEDQKTGDVSLPGATVCEIRDQQSFIQLLRLGEAHRIAANTKLNTESSRSHALLMVHVKKSVVDRDEFCLEAQNRSIGTLRPPILRKGKLIVVDLAGSERIHKSGSEGHMLEEAKSINLSLSSLGKCINEEKTKCQMDYMESIKKLEEKWTINQQKHAINAEINNGAGDEKVAELKRLLQDEVCLRKAAEDEIQKIKNQLYRFSKMELAGRNSDGFSIHQVLEEESCQKKKLEEEVRVLRSQLAQISIEAHQVRSYPDGSNSANPLLGLDSLEPLNQMRSRDCDNGERASITNLHEQVGLQKILSLLQSEDANVQIHAVKVVANLAAEEGNQEKIVEAGGLTSLLMLLRTYDDETIRRIAAGAIANLAMNEANQELIMAQGGICLLAMTATDAEDPQTLRMVAGAIANLCGNDKLQMRLRSEGGIKALLGMVRCRHPDVLSQVARGIANFAKCESRASSQGSRHGRSLLIDDGALPWIVQNANSEASLIRRHVELALCHLAQHEVNVKDMISGGALWELVRISRDCSREDIRALARRTLTSSSTFQSELRRLRIEV